MELRQLEYFVAVAKIGNITKAAELLFVSQPTITVAIKKLEKELGVDLFIREYKKLTLTPEGEKFFETLQPTLLTLQNTIDAIKDSKNKTSGSIQIGIPPMISTFVFAPLLKHFRKTYPQWELTVIEEGSIGIRQELFSKNLDLGIVITNNLDDELEMLPLMEGEHKLCVPSSHPFAQEASIPFSALKGESLIMMKIDSFHRQEVLRHCHDAGFDPNIVLSSNQIATNIDSVADGVGLSFLLDLAKLRREDVKMVSMDPPLRVSIGVVWPKDKYLSYASRELLHYLKTEAFLNEK